MRRLRLRNTGRRAGPQLREALVHQCTRRRFSGIQAPTRRARSCGDELSSSRAWNMLPL